MTLMCIKCITIWQYTVQDRDRPIMLIFYLLCYAAVLKFLTYYAQYYAHVKELCLNLTVLLEYIQKLNMVSVLLE